MVLLFINFYDIGHRRQNSTIFGVKKAFDNVAMTVFRCFYAVYAMLSHEIALLLLFLLLLL